MSSISFIGAGVGASAWRLVHEYRLKPVPGTECYVCILVADTDGKVYAVQIYSTEPGVLQSVLLTEQGTVEVSGLGSEYYFVPGVTTPKGSSPLVLSYINANIYSLPRYTFIRDSDDNVYLYDFFKNKLLGRIGYYRYDYTDLGFVWFDGDDLTRYTGEQYYAMLEPSALRVVIARDGATEEFTCQSVPGLPARLLSAGDRLYMVFERRVSHGGYVALDTSVSSDVYECRPGGVATKVTTIYGNTACYRAGSFHTPDVCGFYTGNGVVDAYTPPDRCIGLYMIHAVSDRPAALRPLFVESCKGHAMLSPVMQDVFRAWALMFYSYRNKYYLALFIHEPGEYTNVFAPFDVKVYEFDPSRVGA